MAASGFYIPPDGGGGGGSNFSPALSQTVSVGADSGQTEMNRSANPKDFEIAFSTVAPLIGGETVDSGIFVDNFRINVPGEGWVIASASVLMFGGDSSLTALTVAGGRAAGLYPTAPGSVGVSPGGVYFGNISFFDYLTGSADDPVEFVLGVTSTSVSGVSAVLTATLNLTYIPAPLREA